MPPTPAAIRVGPRPRSPRCPMSSRRSVPITWVVEYDDSRMRSTRARWSVASPTDSAPTSRRCSSPQGARAACDLSTVRSSRPTSWSPTSTPTPSTAGSCETDEQPRRSRGFAVRRPHCRVSYCCWPCAVVPLGCATTTCGSRPSTTPSSTQCSVVARVLSTTRPSTCAHLTTTSCGPTPTTSRGSCWSMRLGMARAEHPARSTGTSRVCATRIGIACSP